MLIISLATACSKNNQSTNTHSDNQTATPQNQLSEIQIDNELQRVVSETMAGNEGTAIVLDPQQGRIRAIFNPRLAVEQRFPPGSAIKPFTALVALREGIIRPDTRRLCHRHYENENFQIECSHKQSTVPFNLEQALAYSCNYYFASVGARISAGAFNSTLASFGFGVRTGVNYVSESEGKLPRSGWSESFALGETDQLFVTPVQLIRAYTALVNGVRLMRLRAEPAATRFSPAIDATINIASEYRAAIIKGMIGAMRYGTAAPTVTTTGESITRNMFGKTGTSTASNQFRTQGWFVGFTNTDQAKRKGIGLSLVPSPEEVSLAVLVFLKRAHGANSAQIGRRILTKYNQLRNSSEPVNAASSKDDERIVAPGKEINVRLLLVGEQRIITLPLEEYLIGVLTGEAGSENRIEALKAQAIVSRTFAIKNLGRHASDGYDFTSNTDSQRYVVPGNTADAVRQAVRETAGTILLDNHRETADVYFHASSGGMTANIQSVWGGPPAPEYLRGVPDPYSAAGSRHSWQQSISAGDLLNALQSDPLSDPGSRLDQLVVIRRDTSGRAQLISIKGEHHREITGWTFRLIVGRALGWNFVKSSLFDVERRSNEFLFRGRGFGHGIGLPQESAHVMASKGSEFLDILQFYFPGTRPGHLDASLIDKALHKQESLPTVQNMARFKYSSIIATTTRHQPMTRVLSSEHFKLTFPFTLDTREVQGIFAILESAFNDVSRKFMQASLYPANDQKIEVIIYSSTGDFSGVTGQPWWTVGLTTGKKIELQPISVLRKRGILATTLCHEFVHTQINQISAGNPSRWLSEGVAIYLSGEGPSLLQFIPKKKLPIEEIEKRLRAGGSSQAVTKGLYAAAYKATIDLVNREGEAATLRRLVSSEF
ncbi:MAG: SpoIID/LytB domain-containing protein [Pyrinomonadaceae bacterium]